MPPVPGPGRRRFHGDSYSVGQTHVRMIHKGWRQSKSCKRKANEASFTYNPLGDWGSRTYYLVGNCCSLAEGGGDLNCCEVSFSDRIYDRHAVHRYDGYLLGTKELLYKGPCQVWLLRSPLDILWSQRPLWPDFGLRARPLGRRLGLPQGVVGSHLPLINRNSQLRA